MSSLVSHYVSSQLLISFSFFYLCFILNIGGWWIACQVSMQRCFSPTSCFCSGSRIYIFLSLFYSSLLLISLYVLFPNDEEWRITFSVSMQRCFSPAPCSFSSFSEFLIYFCVLVLSFIDSYLTLFSGSLMMKEGRITFFTSVQRSAVLYCFYSAFLISIFVPLFYSSLLRISIILALLWWILTLSISTQRRQSSFHPSLLFSTSLSSFHCFILFTPIFSPPN